MVSKLKNVVSKIINKLRSYIPQSLPVGVKEFNAWADDIVALAKAPDNDSLRFALASMVLNLSQSQDRVSKNRMVKILRKGMANQVASGIMYDLKEKQKMEEIARQQLSQPPAQLSEATVKKLTVAPHENNPNEIA